MSSKKNSKASSNKTKSLTAKAGKRSSMNPTESPSKQVSSSPKATGFRVRVTTEPGSSEDSVELHLIAQDGESLAQLQMSPDYVGQLKLHLDAGRDVACGLIPNCTVH